MCLNIGTPKNHHFSFGTNGKVVVLGVPILKHFRVSIFFLQYSRSYLMAIAETKHIFQLPNFYLTFTYQALIRSISAFLPQERSTDTQTDKYLLKTGTENRINSSFPKQVAIELP